MTHTIIVTDETTLSEMEVHIWEGVGTVLFTPDDAETLLLKRDEVVRLRDHLNQYLEDYPE